MERMRFAGLFLSLIILCTPALSQDAPATAPVQHTPADDLVASPVARQFRMPHYPASEREAMNTGHVDITVLVSSEGYPQEVRSITSEPRNAAFEEVTKNAVAKWRFIPGDKRCLPVKADVSYRIFFEMVDGSERVRAKQQLSQQEQLADFRRKMAAPNKNEILRTLRYPRDARRAGVAGSVYLLLKVDPASGAIDSVDVASATSDRPGFESSFSDAAIEVARKFIFTPMPELKAPHRICVPFVFALG